VTLTCLASGLFFRFGGDEFIQRRRELDDRTDDEVKAELKEIAQNPRGGPPI
jgi:hypothetical protein